MNETGKPVAIVLGGTNPHVTLVNKLKERGYYTILLDYLPNPPAKHVADEHIQESTMDKEAVLQIAEQRGAALVITTNIDQANITACYVAEKLGLPHPYSYETALNVTDKSRMKKIMWDNEIPTAAFKIVETVEEALKTNIPYPVVIKPADSNGSRGVHKCENEEEIRSYFSEALEMSRTRKVVIEQFVVGTEVSYYYFIQRSKAYYITSNQRFRFKAGTEGVIQSAGGIYPTTMSHCVYEKMKQIADKIALAFDLKDTPIFIQAIIDEEENVYVLEFAPRIGGGLSFRLIETENKFDIISATINTFLGIESELNMVQPESFSAVMNIYTSEAVVGDIIGEKELVEQGVAQEFYQYKLRGASVSGDMSSGSRVGAFFLRGNNAQEIYDKIGYINHHMDVCDISGESIMRHDIYNV